MAGTKGPALDIRSDSRVALVGMTGSGKTFFAMQLVTQYPRLVVFDPKGTLGKPQYGLTDWTEKGAKALLNGEGTAKKPVRLRVPAPVTAARDPWEPYFEMVYRAGNCVAYVDEVYGVVPRGTRPGPYYAALYTRGRELGLGTWGATQRPVWVPLEVLSEADWLFCFFLQMLDDRQRMAQLMGPAVLDPIPDPHGFWFKNAAWREPVYTSGLHVPDNVINAMEQPDGTGESETERASGHGRR